jgi:predicted NBD/HSP70 family sugar kinase
VYGGGHASDENLIVINMKHGIGSGILINGRLFQGDGGGAGEIGHVVVQGNNELCSCGKRGCLETISSARAVLKNSNLKSLDQAQEAYVSGDEKVAKVVNGAAHHLGMVLANLIGTLNIHRIVLTGDMTQFGPAWLDAVSEAMRNAVLARMSENTLLELGALDYRACILGASAFLLLDDYSLLFALEN